MQTKKEHVKILAKNVVMRLEQDEAIAVNPRTRQMVYQDLFLKLEPLILTDEDIRAKVIAQLGLKAEELGDTGYTENDHYRAAKSVLMAKHGENAVAGLYYQIPVKSVAQQIGQFLMKHNQVEDVFSQDEDLEKSIVQFLKRFAPEQLH
ncbi:DUF507 family protein [bacterium]|jgi:hypothetical protein|nr:DUF507 family protein [bacterium]